MTDTGTMISVDLNADLAEGDVLTDTDLALLDTVTSASLACGFHAGSREVMRAAALVCVARGVAIGAHVSFRDRPGFGRRMIEVDPDQLVRDIGEQCAVLSDEVAGIGGRVRFVKPHGALYNLMGTDGSVAAAVVAAVAGADVPVLVAQGGTAVIAPARRAGLRVVREGFPDRGYRPDGLLASREMPGALVDDAQTVGRRAISLVRRHGLTAVDGSWTTVEADTLCIHGDSPDAARTAVVVRSHLEADGIVLRSFVDVGPPGTPGSIGPGTR